MTYESRTSELVAEMRLLAAAYADPSITSNSEYSTDLFVHENARSVYEAIRGLYESGTKVSRDAVVQAAMDINLTIDAAFVDGVLTTDPPEDLKDVVAKLKLTRKVVDLKDDFASVVKEIDSKGLDNAARRLYEMADSLSIETDRKVLTFEKWFEEYDEENKQRMSGKRYKFNHQVLDDLVPTGPSPGTGGLVVASSGAGKSSFVLDLIDKLVEIDVPCFYFSLEMGKMDTMDRWMAMRTGVPFASFVDPKPEEWISLQSLVKKERDFLEKKKYFRFCESATMSINDCRREITKFKKEASIDYAVVVFDLLSMLRDFNGFYEGTNFAQVAEVSINKLNAVAKELNVSWVGVLQMNRSVEDTKVLDWKDCEKMRPQRNQIKNSNAYLERARWVVTLFRPLYYAKMYLKPEQYVDHDEDVIEVNLVKANNADVQSREMYFDGATFQLTAK